MIKANATFTGENGSCGFEKGKAYNLEISKRLFGGLLVRGYAYGNGRRLSCPYGSFVAFLKNWTNVIPL